MDPRHGEVWLVDMGMAAKTRPGIVLIADNLNAPRFRVFDVKSVSGCCQTQTWNLSRRH